MRKICLEVEQIMKTLFIIIINIKNFHFTLFLGYIHSHTVAYLILDILLFCMFIRACI